jgi:TolB-like protein/Tfp pilus assembly protein PilF
MQRLVAQIQAFVQELRRRRVIRVAVVYATTGFVILQTADILQPALRLPTWTVRLITLLLLLGFPLALGLAWVYNVTDEGVERAGDGPGAASSGSSGAAGGLAFTSNGLIVGLLVVAIGLLLYPRVFSPEEEPGQQVSPVTVDTAQVEDRSIAVLPFEALSGGERSETFARGIHDDLLTRLANISALKVISRTAVESYRDTELTTRQIAEELDVRWVMEGGVQVLGDQIQVNAQLIDPHSETHRWAEDYRRALTAEDLFAVQGEITGEIAGALRAKLTAAEQERVAGAPTQNLRAYRLYVKGRSQLDTRTEEGIRRAANFFQQALREDSTFALAWSGLADAQELYRGYAADTLDMSVPTPKEAARRALTFGPNLAEAHASMALVYLHRQSGPAGLRHLKRAVTLKPSYAQAYHWLGGFQVAIGRPKAGLEHLRRAEELNPQQPGILGMLVQAHLANRDPEEALSVARRIPPVVTGGRTSRAVVLFHLQRWDEARRFIAEARSETVGPNADVLRMLPVLIAVAGGDTTEARRRLARVDEGTVAPLYMGLMYAAIGNLDRAFKTIERVEEWRPYWILNHVRYHYWKILSPLRADPRYDKLVRGINRAWGLNPDGTIPKAPDSLDTGPTV